MLKAVFMGTPDFALPSLEKLCKLCNVCAVVCQPDRAKDRKGRFVFSPIKQYAIDNGIPVYQFEKIKLEGVQILKELAPDIIITCAYGQILSQEILDIPRFGILNVHASLLPYYRGSSPLQWSLMNGETVTGVTIMKTDIGMDTGDILAARTLNIHDDWYVDDLFDAASKLGSELLAETLPKYIDGEITPVKQNNEVSTHCKMLKKEDALIDWSMDADSIRNKIRGMGYGYTFYNGDMLKIYKLNVIEENGQPGTVTVANGKLLVGCGNKSVEVLDLQLQSRKRMKAVDFLNGVRIESGEKLGN